MSSDAAESPPIPDEEWARAEIYALLAQLFYAPPDARLLGAIAKSGELVEEEAATPLALAWLELKKACAETDAAAVKEEYDTVFVGTGKAEVTLYLGAYVPRSGAGPLVVELKEYLAGHGLARRDSVNEPEDHVAAVLEVMRHFIAEARLGVAEQKQYFDTYVWSGATALCAAIEAAEAMRFFRIVARFARSFLELEHTAFDIG